MTFVDRLAFVQSRTCSLLCIGLDTDPASVPAFLRRSRNAVLDFNRRIIDATHDLVCAYKLNLAFYEALGKSGWITIHKTLEYIPAGILSIGDAKRGDIGNTAELYAESLFDDFRFDACTVSPYMGRDSVEPFLAHKRKGVFVLGITSNPGARDFQHLKIGKQPLYEYVACTVAGWNKQKNCGLVVGATRPSQLKRIRTLAPHLPLLIPGVGAQGGDLRSAVRYGCDKRGVGAIINVSRSIIFASGKKDFAVASRTAALLLRNQIEAIRERHFGVGLR